MEDESILNKNPQEKPIWQWVLDFVIWALCIVALVWVLAGTSGIKEYVGRESSQPYEVNDTIQIN